MPLPSTTARRSLALLFAAATSASEARADAWSDALAASARAEAAGDLDGAVQPLRAALDAYPQDVALLLALGRIELARGRSAEAVRAYREATARSPRAADAYAGLAWALAAERRCGEARDAALVASALERALDATAVAGACEAAIAVAPEVAVAANALAFPGHARKSWAWGATVSTDAALGSLRAGATVRALSVSSRAAAVVPSFGQQEAYARVGWQTLDAGVGAVGAVVRDASGETGTSGHAGLALRASPAGDLLLSLAASFYPDGSVLRAEPAWRLPLGGGLYATPAFALSRALGATYGAGSLSLSLAGVSGSAWVGAKYGAEVRPAYLAQSVVYDLAEPVRWGASAGGSLRLARDVDLRLTLSFDALGATAASGASAIYAASFGPAFRL